MGRRKRGENVSVTADPVRPEQIFARFGLLAAELSAIYPRAAAFCDAYAQHNAGKSNEGALCGFGCCVYFC
jgi:hypothetical protein